VKTATEKIRYSRLYEYYRYRYKDFDGIHTLTQNFFKQKFSNSAERLGDLIRAVDIVLLPYLRARIPGSACSS
jgi:hypothetical protein